jgi:hypothetical protein
MKAFFNHIGLIILYISCLHSFNLHLRKTSKYFSQGDVFFNRQAFSSKLFSESRRKVDPESTTPLGPIENGDAGSGSNGSGNMVEIPLDGIFRGSKKLFETPLDVYDPYNPLADTDGIPGEMGSPEKMQGILERVEQKVEFLREQGQWKEGDDKNFIENLSDIEILTLITKSARPFDSLDEFALTSLGTMLVAVVFSIIISTLTSTLSNAMDWYIATDFDAEFFSNLLSKFSIG